MTDSFPLATDFPAPDLSQWQALAEKALKGAPLSRLTGKTHEGVSVQALYTAKDGQAIAASMGEAGSAPFVRGATAVRDRFMPWDMRQTILNPDPVEANRIALEDLERGVSSLEFVLDPQGACGVQATTTQDFKALLRGIMLPLASVALSGVYDLSSVQALCEAIPDAERQDAKLAFNLDPLAAIMNGQSLQTGPDFAQSVKQLASQFPNSTALRADARPIHEGGGSQAQELAVLIASGIAQLKLGEAAGLTPDQVNQTLLFTLSVGPDVVLEIAKLRAARRLWARVLDACGVVAPMKLQAATSGRMQSRFDPWTNILRATCAGFGAAAGGADVITILPFTSAIGLADAQARRIARNSQIILQEESHLGRVTDPAGGAWAMETLADDLAKAAWPLVQEIERAGGLEAALTSGLVAGWVSATRAERERDVATRKTQLIGINMFANLGEIAPPALAHQLIGEPKAGQIPPMRLAASYEALRQRAEAIKPKVFLATLGPLAKFGTRAGFARNAFEAGGIAALGAETFHEDDAALATAFRLSGAHIVCLCADDTTYEARAVTAASALKATGAKLVWIAGKFEGEGIDRNIYAGADVLAELTHAITFLEGVA